MRLRSKLSPAVAACMMLGIAVSATAQEPTGIISGTITDTSGALVPNANITIINKGTGAARATVANGEGLYSAPSLLPAEYEVRVEQPGFRTVVAAAQVEAGGTTNLDLTIMPGAPSEVVNVEAAAAQVDYDSHAIQGVIQRQIIEDLPLNGRSSLQLASLEPGVTVVPGSIAQFNAMFNVSVFGTTAGATGGSGVGSRLTIDGGTINDEMEGGTSMNFSQEVVQEFQLSTLNFDASTGIAAAGAINIISRSGGNDFHGSVYYFYRDHNIAAYPGLSRSPLFPSPFFQRKNPGFLLGGPIKKDKLFFFFNYEHLGQTAVLSEQEDLPSVQALSGVWPEPYHYNLVNARFDYHLSQKNNLFVRYTHDGNAGFGPYALTPQPASFNFNKNWSDQSLLGFTSVITPALVNDLRFQYHYWENNVTDALPTNCTYPCVGFGLPSIVSYLGSATYNTGTSVNSPQFRQARSYEWSDTLSWQKGSHRIQFGIDYEYMRTKVAPWDFCDPGCDYVFSPEDLKGIFGAATALLFPTLPKTINSTADLLNLPIYNLPSSIYSGVGVGNGTFPGLYQHGQGGTNQRIHPYIADTWKLKPNFTINLGLGYDLETGLFYSNLPLPQFLAPIVNSQTIPGGLGATQPNKLDLAPQFGFAWALGRDKKTVIRGGGGMYWDTQPIWQHFREGASIGPPGDGRTTLAASAFTNTIPGILALGATGFAPLPMGAPLPVNTVTTMTLGQFIQIVNQELPGITAQLAPTPPASGAFSVSGIDLAKQGIEIYPSSFPLLRSYQTSIGVQREFGHNFLLSVDWARKQGENVNLGELDLNHYGRTSDGLAPIIPRCTAAQYYVAGQECSTGSITFWVPEGRSVYDGLLVKLQKRFSQRYQFTASYAMQKLLSENAAVNLDNYFAGYGPVLARHNLNIAGTGNLWWGVKVSLNSSIISPTPTTPTISGIDLNGAGNTTFPLTEADPKLSYNCFNAGCGQSDLAAAVAYFNSTWAGTKAKNGVTVPTLVLPSNYSLGRPIISQDMRLTKEFVYKERYRLSVFGEAFNLFNIANLTGYNFTLDAVKTPQTFAFGQPNSRGNQVFGSGGPRAFQFGARISF
ncbi:MAG TPA: carboxypeptidase-like regulatory domain-containing protein [Bryobacteraceae bacterium]|nr:carboxypeptidase-like regulatory domain-containing protein [Bryobacteraceae bacterium]